MAVILFKKIFSSETTEPISTKLCWNDPCLVPFQNCVRQRRPVSKMAAITENKNFFGEDFFKFHPPFFLVYIIGHNRQKFKVHKISRNIC
jgi:hypothetical protein